MDTDCRNKIYFSQLYGKKKTFKLLRSSLLKINLNNLQFLPNPATLKMDCVFLFLWPHTYHGIGNSPLCANSVRNEYDLSLEMNSQAYTCSCVHVHRSVANIYRSGTVNSNHMAEYAYKSRLFITACFLY